MIKQCSRCKSMLPLDKFTQRPNGSYKPACKPCLSGYARKLAADRHHTESLRLSHEWLRRALV